MYKMPIPNPTKGESRNSYVSRFMSNESMKKEYPDEKQRVAIAYQKWRESHKGSKELNERICLRGLKKKEDSEYTYTALAATTHPDRVGDILSVNAIQQIADYINDNSTTGGDSGSYRSVSLFHDWITSNDPTLDEAAFIVPNSATVVDLDGDHKGVQVDIELNKFYKGNMTVDEIDYRIQQGGISGLSIEYDTSDSMCKNVSYNGDDYRFIDGFTEFGGIGLARARMIANPHAVIYKEIENIANTKSKEEIVMAEEEIEQNVDAPETTEEPQPAAEAAHEEPSEEPEIKEAKIENINYKELASEIAEKVISQQKENKPIKVKEENKMDSGVMLHVKEMTESLKSNDVLSFKEAARRIYSSKEYDASLRQAMNSHGVPLNGTTFSVGSFKEKGNHACKEIVSHRLRITGQMDIKEMQTKDTLDTASNTTSYTQSPVEFSDLYVPGIIDTFNNRTDLFDALKKEQHIMGSTHYQWRISASQKSSLSVDVDDPSITKSYMDKVKLQTPIKEYRNGISVTDFAIIHSRAAIGDLFMIEAEKAALDLRTDINEDLFNETADGDGTDCLGLEAVADSTGNATLYGLTRSTANRLKAGTLTDTYVDVSGALTTAYLRAGITKVEVEGARRGNLLIVTSPYIRDALFELLDGQQQLFTNADFGFSGAIRFDGVPVLVDSDCPSTATERQLYIIDLESDVIVISRAPQLVGLAKVGAAQEAYVVIDFAHVYKNPRRIHMLDNLT